MNSYLVLIVLASVLSIVNAKSKGEDQALHPQVQHEVPGEKEHSASHTVLNPRLAEHTDALAGSNRKKRHEEKIVLEIGVIKGGGGGYGGYGGGGGGYGGYGGGGGGYGGYGGGGGSYGGYGGRRKHKHYGGGGGYGGYGGGGYGGYGGGGGGYGGYGGGGGGGYGGYGR